MNLALQQAKRAAEQGEVPVGAVVVLDQQVIGSGYNRSIIDHDPSAHAEIMALRDAGVTLSNYRLNDATLYVTLEPCIMCAGAILHARIARLVFGARDPRAGAAGSQLNLLESRFLNHQSAVVAGVMAAQCRQLLQDFFAAKRGD